MKISFEKASPSHIDIIFHWLAEPHMMEFWDNTQAHKDDILNFIHGQKQHYFEGTTHYWIGLNDNIPYAFVLSDILKSEQDLPDIYREYLSLSGHTISLDFGIGNKDFLGKGLGAKTLCAFMDFYQNHIDPLADTFCIDPDKNNPRAKHVYKKAGFEEVGNYSPTEGAFIGQMSSLMIKKLNLRSIA